MEPLIATFSKTLKHFFCIATSRFFHILQVTGKFFGPNVRTNNTLAPNGVILSKFYFENRKKDYQNLIQLALRRYWLTPQELFSFLNSPVHTIRIGIDWKNSHNSLIFFYFSVLAYVSGRQNLSFTSIRKSFGWNPRKTIILVVLLQNKRFARFLGFFSKHAYDGVVCHLRLGIFAANVSLKHLGFLQMLRCWAVSHQNADMKLWRFIQLFQFCSERAEQRLRSFEKKRVDSEAELKNAEFISSAILGPVFCTGVGEPQKQQICLALLYICSNVWTDPPPSQSVFCYGNSLYR